MSQLRRLAKIYYVVGKYQLDNLIDKRRLPLTLRAALVPSKLFSNSKLSRGERLRCALEELGPIFIKFGQLYAQKGSWEGKQLVNKAFMEQSMQPISEGPGELYGMHTSIRKMSENKRLLVKEGFNGQYLFVIPEENLVAVKFTKYLHNRENGYVISLGPMDYLLWLPFSWLKAIGEAFAGDGESDPEQNDGSINMPATMSVKDKFNCPNTTTDKCPPVQRIQDLVFGLTDLSPSQE